MAFENYQTKESVVVVYTGEGKGKTSAALGLMTRALGNRFNVAFIQFIKYWGVGEHVFIRDIQPLFKDQLFFYKGGKGFFKAGEISAEFVTEEQHNNAVHDGLLSIKQLKELINLRSRKTNLCLTGRDFPDSLLKLTDIATNMTKLRHHFDEQYLANPGIDY
jgi:cob(I)alamin adenosyltransferase